MIENGDHVVAGVSGGADSVCLLRVLCELRECMGFSLSAVHVEHGIRGAESLSDAAFVRELCAALEVPLLSFSVDAPGRAGARHQSLEEAARDLRYESFYAACRQLGANRLAVAHHGDDCAETLLFHLSRGTGIRGLCGIVPVRKRFKVRRLDKNDFGYLMEHLYGRDGVAYEDYEYSLPEKKLKNCCRILTRITGQTAQIWMKT